MELIKIFTDCTGLEVFLIMMGIFGSILSIVFTIGTFADDCSVFAKTISIIALIICIGCLIATAYIEDYTVYRYLVKDTTQLEQKLDEGYIIESVDGNVYDLREDN